MEYQVLFKANARKDLKALPEKDQYRVLAILPLLASNPFVGKKLKGQHANEYAMKVWPYWVVYRIFKQIVTVVIVRIGHRKDVYT